jgi:hypothetical protein
MLSEHRQNDVWDVAVIGGGPAGMRAAAEAAHKGARVILMEKNASLGKKLLITGGGRCNVTNAEPDAKKLLARFKAGGKFLASPFSKWGVKETLEYFHSRNMATKIEAEQRVFPESNTARSVWDVLVRDLRNSGVTVQTASPVKGIEAEGARITGVRLKDGACIKARSYILATGGISHPETGSTGDGYSWLSALGHTINKTNVALVPIATREPWVKRAAGVSMKEAKITLYLDGIKQSVHKGKVLITHTGLSGPGILNMSREIGESLSYGTVELELDLLPQSGFDMVNEALQTMLKEQPNKMIKNVLGTLIPPALVPVILVLAGIDANTFNNALTRTARIRLMKQLKQVRVTVKNLLGADKAVITSGGIAPAEVDFQTMRSRRYENLYVTGDLLDIERPSGGFSLQLCWTTGSVAGASAAAIRA